MYRHLWKATDLYNQTKLETRKHRSASAKHLKLLKCRQRTYLKQTNCFIMLRINIKKLAWVTGHCLGWFKWGFKNRILMQVEFYHSIMLRLPDIGLPGPCRPLQVNALSLWPCTIWNMHHNFCVKTPLESEWPWLQKHTGPRSFQIQIWGPKRCFTPTKLGVIKCPPKRTPEAPEPLQANPFRPPGPWRQGIGCPTSPNKS